jgi:hypothetical protein
MPIDTPQNIIAVRAPEWASDPRLDDMVALAELQTSEGCFGEKYDHAVALRVMHWMASEKVAGGDPGTGTSSGGGSAGSVKSEKEGELQRAYGGGSLVTAQRNADLSTTQFGRELMELMDACIISARTRFVGGCS